MFDTTAGVGGGNLVYLMTFALFCPWCDQFPDFTTVKLALKL